MPDTTSDDRLRLHIEAIESLNEEAKGISDDRKDRFSLAKGEGFDVKVMKDVIRRRAIEREQVEEHDAVLQTYENSLA